MEVVSGLFYLSSACLAAIQSFVTVQSPATVPVTISGHDVWALVDTGSSDNFISKESGQDLTGTHFVGSPPTPDLLQVPWNLQDWLDMLTDTV